MYFHLNRNFKFHYKISLNAIKYNEFLNILSHHIMRVTLIRTSKELCKPWPICEYKDPFQTLHAKFSYDYGFRLMQYTNVLIEIYTFWDEAWLISSTWSSWMINWITIPQLLFQPRHCNSYHNTWIIISYYWYNSYKY